MAASIHTFSQSKEEVDGTDILAIPRKAIELLEADDSEKIVNISGGWELLAQGLLYGCYGRPNLVSKIVCNNIDKSEEELVDLPQVIFELSEGKKAFLRQ
ncbi:MAG: hypothetical protein N3G80_01490 [Candidatus Micrarchaeota archaeon]|nr:hypothetical protein [Candidatus Micrarchaeota archaeon]